MLTPDDITLLKVYWAKVGVPNMGWDEVVSNYSDPARHYHGLGHIKSCIDEWRELERYKFTDIQAILPMIWLHDWVYDPTRSDNEFLSAREFMCHMNPSQNEENERVVRGILATKDHRPLSSDPAVNLFLDIDLSILGKSPEEYEEYSKNIRLEFGHVPDALYREGRKRVLRNFLDRDTLYITPWFMHKYEIQARENIQNEIAKIGE